MAFEARALTGTLLGDRYLVGELASETHLATRFRGEDARTGGAVDVTVVRDGLGATSHAARALELEAMTASEIRHPNVVTPRDVGVLEDGSPYVVTIHQSGETLEERVYGRGALGIEDVVRIGLELLSALAAAHELEIVHGDLRPEHVFLVERDGLVLQTLLSGFGRVLGSTRRITSDLQAVGELLHFAATGLSPWSTLAGYRPPLPARIGRVIDRALANDPLDRFGSAREMLAALDAARRGEGCDREPGEPGSVRVTPMAVHQPIRPCYGLNDPERTIKVASLRAAG